MKFSAARHNFILIGFYVGYLKISPNNIFHNRKLCERARSTYNIVPFTLVVSKKKSYKITNKTVYLTNLNENRFAT